MFARVEGPVVVGRARLQSCRQRRKLGTEISRRARSAADAHVGCASLACLKACPDTNRSCESARRPSFVSGHGFSRAASRQNLEQRSAAELRSAADAHDGGASLACLKACPDTNRSSESACRPSFVSGRGFSRAASRQNLEQRSAAELRSAADAHDGGASLACLKACPDTNRSCAVKDLYQGTASAVPLARIHHVRASAPAAAKAYSLLRRPDAGLKARSSTFTCRAKAVRHRPTSRRHGAPETWDW
jgi:hypothetical protein